MQCVDFEHRLHELLDARRRPEADAALQAHAAGCPHCAQQLQSQQRLFTLLSRLKESPAEDFADHVLLAVREAETTGRRRSQQLRAVLALATALSLGVVAWSYREWGASRAGNVIPAVDQFAQPTPPQNPVRQHPPGFVRPPAALATRYDRRKTEEKFTQYREVIVSLANQIGESSELDEVSASLQPGLKPLRSSFGLAIDALRRTIPRGREGRQSAPNDGALTAVRWPVVV
jgi:hypothetical protein